MKKLISSAVLFAFLFVPLIAFAQINNGAYLNNFAGTAGYVQTDLPVVVGNIINIVLSLLGLVAVIFIIIGGFMWMTSAGNEEKLKKAKGMIQAAIVGLVIVMLAYVVVSFVFEKGIGIIGG